MRQVAKRLKDGRLEVIDVPAPAPGPGQVSVRVGASVLSSGTEGATLDVARKGLVAKARARPDQARQVVDRARSEGVRSTLALVRERLEELGPLGYSAAGEVIEAGAQARGLSPGDRVAIAGGGFANHAEVDVVPSLLCARIPAGVATANAAFATLGAIALHGLRRAEATVGETVAVIGLGLIGQLAVRVSLAAGCRVLAVDPDGERVGLAVAAGAEGLQREALGKGEPWAEAADAALICAATSSSDPVQLAAALLRDRGKVVVVGDVALDLPRGPYYDKELDVRLARSYGPGRYDPEYELHGLDYPIGYARWTQQRNLDAFLRLVASGRVRPAELVTHTYPLAAAEQAFDRLREPGSLAVMLDYGTANAEPPRAAGAERTRPPRRRTGKPRFGLIGAGRFATSKIVPGLTGAGLEPAAVASASGLSAQSVRQRFGFASAHAGPEELLQDEGLDLVVIATRHDSHASLAARALRNGTAVYVEKPLALDAAGLRDVIDAQASTGAPLIVGFNRRLAPLAQALRDLPGPRLMSYRVNAGRVPASHWTNDLAVGGGRLLGEGCHFVDFLCHQAGVDPVTVTARGFPSDPSLPLAATDNFSVQVGFADGGVGTLSYAADSPSAAGKERFETSSPGVFASIEDFRSGVLVRGTERRKLGGRGQDKGFEGQWSLIAKAVRQEGPAPDPHSWFLSSLATIAAARSLGSGQPEPVVLTTDQAANGPAPATPAAATANSRQPAAE